MDTTNTTNEVEDVDNEHGFDHLKLKEERKLRRKQKKAAKKLHKQKEREQKELVLKLQVKSNNVTLITRDFANKVVGNSSVTESFDQQIVNSADFPALGTKCKAQNINLCKVTSSKNDRFPIATVETDDEKKKLSKIEFADFLHIPTTSKHIKPIVQNVENYNGNPLDSDMPIRKRGKHREVPKMKKLSKLKRDNVFHTHETISLEKTNLCDNIITQELNDWVTIFISAIVGLQEKLYKRDSVKGKSKRRYVVGLHSAKKCLNLNKAKMIILGADIKLIEHDGAINRAIREIIDLAQTNNIPYLFALKRRSLGTLTMKNIPASCIAILNYEGLEEYYNNITNLLPSIKKAKDDCADNIAKDEANQKFLNNLMEALKSDN